MAWLSRFLKSTIGLKIIMGLTGLLLVGFVLMHMLANLQIFISHESLNHYAELLRTWPEALWGARIVLLASVVAHIAAAVVLTKRSRAARPVGYEDRAWLSGTYAVRTMRFGGVIIFFFILYHLAHLTFGIVDPNFVHGDVAANVVRGFQTPIVSAIYIIANIFLGLHLTHGIWSLCRTLGLANPRWDAIAKQAAIGIGLLVALGNISIPVAVLTDFYLNTNLVK